MTQDHHHIISKLKWDTSFNKKEMAYEFQNRLSHWSRNDLLIETNQIFDQVCGADQTWQIKSLELDLGAVNYEDFNQDLSKKFKEALNEKLMNLILYSNSNSNNLQVLLENVSKIEIIRSFLLQGYMSWNYQSKKGTVNQILFSLLKNEKEETIKMIKDVGTLENVRKRIAWQSEAPNILMIIKGLEPSNYMQITDFASELTKIQQKKGLVQTSIKSFKKNIWLWVLNHLLVERGTIFNRKAFVKSSIIQMANHYNIDYNELIESIKNAVESIKGKSSIKQGFVVTLKELIKEHSQIRKQQNDSHVKIDYWLVLKEMLIDSRRKTNAEKEKLNELIISLSKVNRSRFIETLSFLYTSKNSLQYLVNDLDAKAFNSIHKMMAPNASEMIVESIHFINGIAKEGGIKIDEKILREISIKFSIHHKSASFKLKSFLKSAIFEYGKRDKNFKKHFHKVLNNIRVPASLKTNLTVDIYSHLRAVLNEKSKPNKFTTTGFQLKNLLEYFNDLKRTTSDTSFLVPIQNTFIDWLTSDVEDAYKVLTQWSDKAQLDQFLSFVLDPYIASMLLENSKGEARDLILSLKHVIKESNNSTLAFIVTKGVRLFLLNPELGGIKIIEKLFELHMITMSKTHQREFLEHIQKALEQEKMQVYKFEADTVRQLRNRIHAAEEKSIIQTILLTINKANNSQLEVSERLLISLKNKSLTYSELVNTIASKAILNYLIKDGVSLMNRVIKKHLEHLNMFVKQLSRNKIEQQLTKLFWACVLDYTNHFGNMTNLIRLFNKTVMYAFPDSYTAEAWYKETLRDDNKTHKLRNGEVSTQKQLVSTVETFFNNGVSYTNKEVIEFSLVELLNQAFESNTNAVIKLIIAHKITEKHVKILMQSIPFEQFMATIIYGTQSQSKEVLIGISVLYNLAVKLGDKNMTDEAQISYWMHSVEALKSRGNNKKSIEKLVRETVTYIDKDPKVIYNEIKTSNIKMSQFLKDALVSNSNAFRLIQTTDTNNALTKNFHDCKNHNDLEELCYSLIVNHRVPVWYISENKYSDTDLLKRLITIYPLVLLTVLRDRKISDSKLFMLTNIMEADTMFKLIIQLNPQQKQLLNQFEQFYKAISLVTIKGMSTSRIEGVVFKIFIEAWVSGNWTTLLTNTIWDQLIWELSVKRSITKQDLMESITSSIMSFPVAYQVTFNHVANKKEAVAIQNNETALIPKQPLKHVERIGDTIPIKNAGLVLISSYFPLLFERLGLIENNQFINTNSLSSAVHYLQYVTTGMSKTEEQYLPLNKLLCGLDLETPVLDEVEISNTNKELIDGLVTAAIAYWSSIGTTSIDGFRGNWLVREGILIEKEDAWELTVEKRAYDILLNKSPFSFSIIKFPWMDKPLHVTWPY